MKKRLILSTLLAIVLSLSAVLPALAIAPPTVPTPTIDAINVYRDCVETDDQLYIIEYTITYGALPDEVISDAYIFRLMDGAVELKSSTAYAYHTKGYGTGIAAIYFSTAEVTALGMGWIGAYTMNLTGNPTLTWTGTGCPSADSITYESWNDPMSTILGTNVLMLAQELTTDWGWSATPLFTSSGGTTTLSVLGENYFSTSIPNLMTMQPSIFLSSIEPAQFYERANPETYATSIAPAAWAGSWIDDAIQPTVTALGISTNMAYGIFWAIITMTVMGLMIWKTGVNFEILLLVGGIMSVFGSLLHFVPMLIPIIIGVVIIITFIWKTFLQPSGA